MTTERTDTERLDFLAQCDGCALVSDDCGNWALLCTGSQNIPDDPPDDVWTSFFIKGEEFHPSVRAAIDAGMNRYKR